MRPLIFVINPASGNTAVDAVRAAIHAAMQGRSHEILLPRKPAQLSTLARQAVQSAQACGGAVVGIGGDGTMNTVAQAAWEAQCPMGVIAQGTFNYFSRAHGLPQELDNALALLGDAPVEPVQVGMVNGRIFLVNSSLGLYPKVLEDREAYKKQWGRYRWVAMLGALLTLLRHDSQLRLRITLGDKVRDLRTSTLFIANNPLQLERLGLPHAERLREGELAAVALQPASRMELVWLLLRGAFGRLGDADKVISFPFTAMEVAARRSGRMRVATDGEVSSLPAPLRFAVAPRPLMLLCPRQEPAP